MRALADKLARVRAASFVAAVSRDETTGAPVTLEPFHRDILDVLTTAERGAVELPPEHGKSQTAAAAVAWLLGRDPTLRVALVSGTLAQATRQVGSVARLCESPDAQRIYPTLAPGEPWTQSSLALAARPPELRDPNVVASSLDGAGLLGARVDLVVADDVDSLATTSTPLARDSAWRWFASTVMSRLSPRGRVVVLSTTWHREDVLHRFVDLGNVKHLRLPIQDAKGRPLWPARWPAERIAARRRELGPRLAARVLDCKPVSDDSAVFESALVQRMIDMGLALPTTLFDGPRGRYVLGVDVAFSSGPTSDESALVVVRCCDEGRRELVHVESGRWDFDSLTARVVATARAFGATAAVESNGGGRFVYEAARKQVPCTALHTSATSKLARVEWLHAEASAGRWCFRPADGRMTDGMRGLADGLENYSPNEHTDDRVAALLVAVEQIRALESKPKIQFMRVDLLRR